MKYSIGQRLVVSDNMIIEDETESEDSLLILKDSYFVITDTLEGIDYPYLVKFENGYEMALNEDEVSDISYAKTL